MPGLPEIAQWEPTIYEIEATDFASAGPDGHPNLSLRQLGNRTAYLRQALLSATQTVVLPDDDGFAHHMVFIPRFRLPADSLGLGRPARDLMLGGFLVDKYPASAERYVGGIAKAVSVPMRQPWVAVSLDEAAEAASRRRFGGRSAGLMGLREWGHLGWLVELLRHPLRGNQAAGRDLRDADVWENYCEPGYLVRSFSGACPNAWFHNGRPDGVAELLGNVRHMLGEGGLWYSKVLRCNAGCLQVQRRASLVSAIDDSEVSFEIEDPAGFHAPKKGFEQWPLENGLLLLVTGSSPEYVRYGSLVINPAMPWRATVIDCVRGQFGFGPDAHAAGSHANHVAYHHLIPGSYIALLSAGLGGAETDTSVGWDYERYAFGTRDSQPANGDVLCCDDEDLLVVSVVNGGTSGTFQVQRGYNGTPIGPHIAGRALVKYSPTLELAEQGKQIGYATGSLRSGFDLDELRLVDETLAFVPGGSGERVSVAFNLRLAAGEDAFTRGSSAYGNMTETMLSQRAPHSAIGVGTNLEDGFRAVLRLSDYQYGGEF